MPIRPINPPPSPAPVAPATERRRIRIVPKKKSAPPSGTPARASKKPRTGPNRTADGDYLVGKNRPPVHTRWVKGQSGNPAGRRKKDRSLDEEIASFMGKKITVKTAAGEERMTNRSVLIRKLFEQATKGSMSAARILLDRTTAGQVQQADQRATEDDLSSSERALLDHILAQSRDETDPE